MKVCEEHIWPRNMLIKSVRTNGSVRIERCNNCVAIKVVFEDEDDLVIKVVDPL